MKVIVPEDMLDVKADTTGMMTPAAGRACTVNHSTVVSWRDFFVDS